MVLFPDILFRCGASFEASWRPLKMKGLFNVILPMNSAAPELPALPSIVIWPVPRHYYFRAEATIFDRKIVRQ